MLSPNQSSITCTNKVISGSVLKDIILLIVYIWGAYLFLYLQPEYLSSLIERVGPFPNACILPDIRIPMLFSLVDTGVLKL